MSILSSEVWVGEVTEYGVQSVSRVGSDSEAPPEFESPEDIKQYVRDSYGVGEYKILRIDDSVEVTASDELYSEYTAEDMGVIESVTDTFDDEECVVSVTQIDASVDRDVRVERAGVELELDSRGGDVVVEVFTEQCPSENVVDWVCERADGVRLVGWASDSHYERRGARPDPTVRVALKRDVGVVKELQECLSGCSEVQFCVPADALLFVSRVSPVSGDAEQVVVVDVGLPTETSHIGDDPSPEEVLSAVAAEVPSFRETLRDSTGWCVSDIGFVISTEADEFYQLAFGVQYDPSM